MKPTCVFRHGLFLQTFVHVHFTRAAFAKSSLVLTGGAFVRAKHSLSSAISVSQHALLSKRNHHAPSHSKCQRQNKVHLTGVLSHKDAVLQKVFRSHKSQKLDNRKKEQGFGGKRNVFFKRYEVLKMLRWLVMSKLFYRQLLVHPGHIYAQKNTNLRIWAQVGWAIMVLNEVR